MDLTNRLKAWMDIVTGRNSLVYVMAVLMTVLFGRNRRLPSYNMTACDGFLIPVVNILYAFMFVQVSTGRCSLPDQQRGEYEALNGGTVHWDFHSCLAP